MSDSSSLRIAQLLCSRLCHDLVAPVSAMTNGVELFQEQQHQSSEDTDQIIELLALSAHTATRRLELYRFAFGIGATSGVKSLTSLQDIILKTLDPAKFQLQWELTESSHVAGREVSTWSRVLMNMVLMALDCAPYGGKIIITSSSHEPTTFNLTVTVQAPTVVLSEELCQIAQQGFDVESLTPRTVQAYLLHCLGADLGRTFKIEKAPDNKVTFTTLSL